MNTLKKYKKMKEQLSNEKYPNGREIRYHYTINHIEPNTMLMLEFRVVKILKEMGEETRIHFCEDNLYTDLHIKIFCDNDLSHYNLTTAFNRVINSDRYDSYYKEVQMEDNYKNFLVDKVDWGSLWKDIDLYKIDLNKYNL